MNVALALITRGLNQICFLSFLFFFFLFFSFLTLFKCTWIVWFLCKLYIPKKLFLFWSDLKILIEIERQLDHYLKLLCLAKTNNLKQSLLIFGRLNDDKENCLVCFDHMLIPWGWWASCWEPALLRKHWVRTISTCCIYFFKNNANSTVKYYKKSLNYGRHVVM